MLIQYIVYNEMDQIYIDTMKYIEYIRYNEYIEYIRCNGYVE